MYRDVAEPPLHRDDPRCAMPRRERPLHYAIVLSALLFASLATQLAVGAYRGEFGNYPDEAAHFMNALVLRDYLTTGIGENPLRFAETYYLNYPKIAPAMWPPFFHVVMGLFLLPGWSPHSAALALLAIVSALAAWRLYRAVLMFAPPAARCWPPACSS